MPKIRDENIHVVICEGGAIYVNDTRITTRNTKWGIRATLADSNARNRNLHRKYLSADFQGTSKR